MIKKVFVLLKADRCKRDKVEGFTLIELLVALAVGSIILSGSVLGIYQVLVTTNRANNQVVSLADLNRAALSIKYDLMMAQTTDMVEGVTQKNSVSLYWFDYTSSFGTNFQTEHSASYNLTGKRLVRTSENGTSSVVGRNVTFVSFTQSSNVVNNKTVKSVSVVISSSNTTQLSDNETLRFRVHLRAEEIE